ncbi:MAG: tripartite tricarboxylate transporter permease [Desulfovibrio sp.]|jgi:putative tricarboxylic transport membrane protein|nr:tripartite tricarboxylate transporter permease [Desulfovibrio sp.]
MFENIFMGFEHVLTWYNMAMIFAGTALGILVGALPGLSSPMAMIVLLPLTYSFSGLPALLMMMGAYVGTKLGGSYSAILLRTPGTPAAACTVLDGHPMVLQGKAAQALGYATVGSALGGLMGWLAASLCIPVIAGIAVKSGPADIALIGLAGLVMVSSFVRGSMLKGLIGMLLGLLLSTVGLDPQDTTPRMTFGMEELFGGIDFSAALVGFFGIAVVLSDLHRIEEGATRIREKVGLALPPVRELCRRWRAIAIGAFYGLFVGAVPGVGAEGSTWLAYATVRKNSKNPESFGTGNPDGILAPESSNNAVTGGTMLPMLTLGLPGDGSTAIMLGALLLHGMTPGITLIKESPEMVYGLLAGLGVAHVFMFLLGTLAIRPYIALLQNDRAWIFPFVLIMAMVGCFAGTNNPFPVLLAVLFGILGHLMELRDFPIPTVVLGVILGPIIEVNLRLALSLSNDDWWVFADTWPRKIILALILYIISKEIFLELKRMRLQSQNNPTVTP